MHLDSPSNSLAVGEEIVLSIVVDAGSQSPIDAAQTFLNFDPSVLQVVESADPGGPIEPGSVFADGAWQDVLLNRVNNVAGEVGFAGGKGLSGTSANAPFQLARVRFQALAATGATNVTFHEAVPRQTKVVSGFDTVTGALSGKTLTITDPPPANEAMWVNSISFQTKEKNLAFNVVATNASGPVKKAGVQARLTRNDGESWEFNGKTTGRGVARFRLHKATQGNYEATITGLTSADFRWDPAKGVTTAGVTAP